MSDLIPLQPSRGLTRSVRRELTQLTVCTGLSQAQARAQATAEVEAARVSAVASVGQRAMQEVALTTKLERDLCETVPAAQARLVAIGDMTQIAMGSMVMSAARWIDGPVRNAAASARRSRWPCGRCSRWVRRRESGCAAKPTAPAARMVGEHPVSSPGPPGLVNRLVGAAFSLLLAALALCLAVQIIQGIWVWLVGIPLVGGAGWWLVQRTRRH